MREVKGSAAESYARANWMFGLAGLIVIGLVFLGLIPRDKGVTPAPSTSVRQGVQGGVWDKIPAHLRVDGAPVPPEALEALTAAERDAVRCEHEDGNTDGSPCLWIDPQSRTVYYVDSSEYRK